MAEGTFPSPFECSPPGCEGWEEMYPRHALFHDDRRLYDEDRFWFQDGMHWPEPIHPFDAIVVEAMFVGFNQTSARLFAIPPSLGAEYRLLGGYVYSSPNVLTDATVVAQRADRRLREAERTAKVTRHPHRQHALHGRDAHSLSPGSEEERHGAGQCAHVRGGPEEDPCGV